MSGSPGPWPAGSHVAHAARAAGAPLRPQWVATGGHTRARREPPRIEAPRGSNDRRRAARLGALFDRQIGNLSGGDRPTAVRDAKRSQPRRRTGTVEPLIARTPVRSTLSHGRDQSASRRALGRRIGTLFAEQNKHPQRARQKLHKLAGNDRPQPMGLGRHMHCDVGRTWIHDSTFRPFLRLDSFGVRRLQPPLVRRGWRAHHALA
jgi:hypothetical protein